jgi:cytochrome P450
MRTYESIVREAVQREIATWPAGEPFALHPRMQRVTLEVILRAVFGVTDPERRARLGERLARLLGDTASIGLQFNVLLARRFGAPDPLARLASLREEIDALLDAEIAERRADTREDILSMLVEARFEDGEPMADSEIRDQLMSLLLAGHETTATALAWALERLARHPHALAQCQDDAYLDATVKEVLRVRPVLSITSRKTLQPWEVGGYTLPSGVYVSPCLYLAHRRPELWPDPTSFRPERFLEGQPEPYSWVPFGGGTRRCLGASFASLEMREVLRAVASRFTLKPDRVQGERMRRRSVTLAPARGGIVLPTPLA